MLKEFIVKSITTFVFPDLVKEMKEEGTFHLDPEKPVASLEEADFIRIEDHGGAVTIFAFTGPDVLYAGHSRYHLMGVIKRLDRKFGGANFVFLRDPQRLGFMLQPDGSPGGLAFYTKIVRETMERLGATHNVAIGSSFGGSVAHYIAYTCGMQQVITFGAMFNTDSYLGWRTILGTLLHVKQIFKEPRGYFEILLVTISTSWCFQMIQERIGQENLVDLVAQYRDLEQKPAITLFYGEDAPPDVAQARLMRVFPEVKQIPLPTGRHNTPGFLYAKGTLGKYIAEEILSVYRPSVAASE